jgi:hypothetical protein
VSAVNIGAGILKFTPATNGNGAGYAAFTFQVHDDGGTANGGVDLDPTAHTITIDVTAVDDAPVLTRNMLTLGPGAAVTLSMAELDATDVDNVAAGLLFTVSGLTHGQFELAAAPAVPIASFTLAQVNAGQVVFVHDGSSTPPTYDISVSDGSLSTASAPASIAFNPSSVGPITPAPVVASLAVPPMFQSGLQALPAFSGEPTPGATDGVQSVPQAAVHSQPSDGDLEYKSESGTQPSGASSLAPISVTRELANAGQNGAALRIVEVTAPQPHRNAWVVSHETLQVNPLDLGLLIQSDQVPHPEFEGSAQTDWIPGPAYGDDHSVHSKEQISVVLDSVEMGGIVLSVGVVWWASRVSGIIGSLLASAPAWRQLDPLPVIGRDEERTDARWNGEDDNEVHAEEVAISMVLDDSRNAHAALT